MKLKLPRRRWWLLLLASLIGSGSPAERLIKKQIQMENEWADRMESGRSIDPSEATATLARIVAGQLEIKWLVETKLSPEENKQLEKYRPEMQKASARSFAATQKAEKATGKPLLAEAGRIATSKEKK
jgi:hypothetical protein